VAEKLLHFAQNTRKKKIVVFKKMFTLIKRKVFISYHHRNDQKYFELFKKHFSARFDVFYDNSLERVIESDSAQYISRKIKEDYIFGSSVTIVLCGSETFKRKYIDWEIHATLDYKHALIGLALPSLSILQQNLTGSVPDRLYDNIISGYAKWLPIYPNLNDLSISIEEAIRLSRNTKNIRNDRPKIQRNKP
jgi:hypothetical protein